MATNGTLRPIREGIERAQAVVEAVEAMYAHDKAGTRELLDRLSKACGGSAVRRSTTFGRVRKLLEDGGNRPRSKAEIAEQTGIPETTIHSLIYKSNRDSFESLDDPSGGRAKLFRLVGVATQEPEPVRGPGPSHTYGADDDIPF